MNGFDIPTNLYPYSGSTSQSVAQNYSGLPGQLVGWGTQQLQNYWPQMMQGYQRSLAKLASPQSFIQAYQPIQQQLFRNTLNDLGQRRVLNSSAMEKALTESMKWAPQAYFQNLGNIAGLYGSGVSGLQGMLGNLGYSTGGTQQQSSSYQAQPLAPYELMAQMMLGLY